MANCYWQYILFGCCGIVPSTIGMPYRVTTTCELFCSTLRPLCLTTRAGLAFCAPCPLQVDVVPAMGKDGKSAAAVNYFREGASFLESPVAPSGPLNLPAP